MIRALIHMVTALGITCAICFTTYNIAKISLEHYDKRHFGTLAHDIEIHMLLLEERAAMRESNRPQGYQKVFNISQDFRSTSYKG